MTEHLAWRSNPKPQAALTPGLCLDLTDGSTENGNVLQVWTCGDGNANQVWTTNAVFA